MTVYFCLHNCSSHHALPHNVLRLYLPRTAVPIEKINVWTRGDLVVLRLWSWKENKGLHYRNPNSWVARPLQWRHNGRDSVTNHQPHDCILNRLFRRRSKKTSKFRATGLCVGNSPVTGEFPAQMASNAENISIWWRQHVWISNHARDFIWDVINHPCHGGLVTPPLKLWNGCNYISLSMW